MCCQYWTKQLHKHGPHHRIHRAGIFQPQAALLNAKRTTGAPQVTPDAVFGLDQALRVYKEVLGGAKRRIVFNP